MQGALRLVLVLAAALLAGCSATDRDDPDETSRSLKVAHAAGETRVPGQAERLVTLTQDALDSGLALGVRPVGAATADDGRFADYLRGRTAGIEAVGSVSKVDLAAIEALDPDLIIASKSDQGPLYEKLKAIAPTVMTEDSGHSWEVNTRLHGEALGRTDDAERLLTRYDGRAARLSKALGDRRASTEVSVVRTVPGRLRAAGARSFAGTVLGDLGLPRPASQRAQRESAAVPLAAVEAIDADLLLVSASAGGARTLSALESRPAWLRLGAVRSEMVERVSDDVWWQGGGVLAAQAALRDLGRGLGVAAPSG